jgi:UDP-N-acetylglucosamine:LPS N-acetylglucosamine transferase
VTGRPVPAACSAPTARRRATRFGSRRARCLLVMGGSQGARSINECAIEALRRARGRDFDVVHLAGAATTRSCERAARAAPQRERYTLLAYEPDLGDCLAACDLVLGRSAARSSS